MPNRPSTRHPASTPSLRAPAAPTPPPPPPPAPTPPPPAEVVKAYAPPDSASRVAELEARIAAKDALIAEMVAFLRESSKSSSFNHTKAGELVKKAS